MVSVRNIIILNNSLNEFAERVHNQILYLNILTISTAGGRVFGEEYFLKQQFKRNILVVLF